MEHQDKAGMRTGIFPPPPVPCDGDEGQRAHRATLSSPSSVPGHEQHEVPGPDKVSPPSIRCLSDWDAHRVTALIRAHIRLGVHPDRWKLDKEAIISKPGKEDCGAGGQTIPLHLPAELLG